MRCLLLILASALSLVLFPPRSFAAEPTVPPEDNRPRTHIVDLKANANMRMGDTITLKGTDFSARLVGFREPLCAGPRSNCAGQTPIAEFELIEGPTKCEPHVKKPGELSEDPADRRCARKFKYRVVHDPIVDRTAVVVRIRAKKKR